MGLGYWQKMRLVILPQALRLVIPGIVNSFISLFKDTSLVFIMGLYDLLNISRLIVTGQDWLGHDVESYIFAGFGFWIFCFAMSRFSQRLERKLQHRPQALRRPDPMATNASRQRRPRASCCATSTSGTASSTCCGTSTCRSRRARRSWSAARRAPASRP